MNSEAYKSIVQIVQKGLALFVKNEAKPKIFRERATQFVLMIVLSSFLCTCGGFSSSPSQTDRGMAPSAELESYLQTADHLTEKQKEQLKLGRPFVGMTIEEANLAMKQESADLVLSGKTARAVYIGGSGVRYHLYFEGNPQRVVQWSHFSRDEIKLTDPKELRPFR